MLWQFFDNLIQKGRECKMSKFIIIFSSFLLFLPNVFAKNPKKLCSAKNTDILKKLCKRTRGIWKDGDCIAKKRRRRRRRRKCKCAKPRVVIIQRVAKPKIIYKDRVVYKKLKPKIIVKEKIVYKQSKISIKNNNVG